MEFTVKATMPGLVARVVVNEGDLVKEGQEVAVINCMKNEISVASEKSGTVKSIMAKEWDELQVGDPMVMLDMA